MAHAPCGARCPAKAAEVMPGYRPWRPGWRRPQARVATGTMPHGHALQVLPHMHRPIELERRSSDGCSKASSRWRGRYTMAPMVWCCWIRVVNCPTRPAGTTRSIRWCRVSSIWRIRFGCRWWKTHWRRHRGCRDLRSRFDRMGMIEGARPRGAAMEGSEDRIAAPARWASVPRPCGRHRDPCPRRCGAQSLRPCRPQWPDPSDQRLSQPEPGHQNGLYSADRKGVPLVASAHGMQIRTHRIDGFASAGLGSLGRWSPFPARPHRPVRASTPRRVGPRCCSWAARAWVAGWTWATRPARTVAPRLDSAASTRGCATPSTPPRWGGCMPNSAPSATSSNPGRGCKAARGRPQPVPLAPIKQTPVQVESVDSKPRAVDPRDLDAPDA